MKKMKFLLVSMLVMASAVFNVMSAKVIGVPTKGNAVLNRETHRLSRWQKAPMLI